MTTPMPKKGDHAEIAKEKHARYAALTTIDEIDNLISQNEVYLENFEVEDDQRANEVMAKCFSKSYEAETHTTLGILDLDPISKTEAYIFLMENPMYKEMFFGCLDNERKSVRSQSLPEPPNTSFLLLLVSLSLSLPPSVRSLSRFLCPCHLLGQF
ncbi:hypothetical protein CMV_008867 [Castanea mollissima]|uniref:Uncharacterized protein n=1 Tax=Castanea mollissima TaxID=60419 RepID=A0A8J4VZ66_9ROSI|nr:hypothetical protein CMV_008867 [Castanea mollissima]